MFQRPVTELWRIHNTLLTNNKIILEFVANLDKLPSTGYNIHINPMKIEDSCGAPIRLMAFKTPISSFTRMTMSLEVLIFASWIAIVGYHF